MNCFCVDSYISSPLLLKIVAMITGNNYFLWFAFFLFLHYSGQKMSLDALSKRILGVTLNKSWSIQCSNWEAEKLSTQQIEYAMNDALVASHIFLRLLKEKAEQSLDVSEDLSPGEDMLNVRDAAVKGDCDLSPDSQIGGKRFEHLANGADYYETTVDLSRFESVEKEGYLLSHEVIDLISRPYITQRAASLCQGVIDMAFKEREKRVSVNDKGNDPFSPEKSHKLSKNGPVRKLPLYTNCVLTAPDGSTLCTLDRKRADWYIAKRIGKVCLHGVFSQSCSTLYSIRCMQTAISIIKCALNVLTNLTITFGEK